MRIEKILGIIAFVLWFILYIAGASTTAGQIASVSIIAMSVYMIVKSFIKKDYRMLLVIAFMFNYFLVPFNYYLYGKWGGYIDFALNDQTMYIVTLSLLLFLSIILFSVKLVDTTIRPQLQLRGKFAYWFSCVLSLMMIIFLQSGDSIFESGGYGQGETFYSTIYGYSVIPLSVALIYANTPKRRNIVYLLAAFYSLKIILYGGRIDMVILLISMFLLRFQYLLSRLQVVLIMLVGMIFMAAFGAFRGNALNDFYQILLGSINSFSSDGQYAEVTYASLRVIYFVKEGIISTYERVYSFVLYLVSFAVPSSSLGGLGNLSSYLQSSYHTGGGGLVTAFFYVWLGWFGVILIGAFISKVLNTYSKTTNPLYLFYAVLVVANIPRWFAYYPVQLLKLCLWGMVFFYLVRMVQKRIG